MNAVQWYITWMTKEAIPGQKYGIKHRFFHLQKDEMTQNFSIFFLTLFFTGDSRD